MELKEFIKHTVKAYTEAVIELKEENLEWQLTQQETETSKNFNDPFKIDFDVAVYASGIDENGDTRAGLHVSSTGEMKYGSGLKESASNRIRFSIRLNPRKKSLQNQYDLEHDGHLKI